MLWDVFCRVIDNFGDIGVCWRLAVDLGQRGHQVRLWVDDPQALTWMAPQVRWRQVPDQGMAVGQGQPGVEVRHWRDAQRALADWPQLDAGDVVIEAFGCDPPEAFIERMQVRATQGPAAQWVNLEYLSAEDYVERSHGLRSPVWSGPGTGLSKRFFYPGFTPATGGLLREPDLIALRQSQTSPELQRMSRLMAWGVAIQPGDKVVLVFGYDTAPVDALLDRLSASNEPVHVLLAVGQATCLGLAWQAARTKNRADTCVTLHALPPLPQADFDQLLWCCDLNFVRGEDSAVRALWAGRPHVWQIYEQDDGVHAQKLDAFMRRWMPTWPPGLRDEVSAWWHAWNRLAPMPEHLPEWRDVHAPWHLASQASRGELLAQTDLTTQLTQFVASSG